jgi:hypothetical protein
LVGCTFEEVAQKNKRSKDECESFYTQIRMNHLTSFLKGAKSLEAITLYNDSHQHHIPHLTRPGPTKEATWKVWT